MRQKNNISAFTLIELMVWITVIGIMAFWISQFNFSRLSQKQKIDIELIKIVNIFEEIRNNALVWKWVGVNLDTPSSWRLQISTSWSWQIRSAYNISWWNTYWASWDTPFPFWITQIQCGNLDYSSTGALNGTWTFTFINNTIDFSGTNCNNAAYKRIYITYWLGNLLKTIAINTLSGVIEVN